MANIDFQPRHVARLATLIAKVMDINHSGDGAYFDCSTDRAIDWLEAGYEALREQIKERRAAMNDAFGRVQAVGKRRSEAAGLKTINEMRNESGDDAAERV